MPTPEEVLAEFTRMQQEKNKPSADAFAVPESVREESGSIIPFTPVLENADLDLIDTPADAPINPLEIEPTKDRLPHLASTGPIVPPVNKLNVFDGRARVPANFMSSVAVILKDAGADSMSQEKALARINELLDWPKPESPILTAKGIPATDPPSPVGNTTVIHSEIPGHPNPE